MKHIHFEKKILHLILLSFLLLLFSFPVHAENECEILAAGNCASVFEVPGGSTGEISQYSSECKASVDCANGLTNAECRCYCTEPFYPGADECEYRGYRCAQSPDGPLRTESDPANIVGYSPIPSEGTVIGHEYSARRDTQWTYHPNKQVPAPCEWSCAQGYVRQGRSCVSSVLNIPPGAESCHEIGGEGCMSIKNTEAGTTRLDEGDIWCNAVNPGYGSDADELICVRCNAGYTWIDNGIGESTGYCGKISAMCDGVPPTTTTGTIINDGTNSFAKLPSGYSFQWAYTETSSPGPCRWTCETGYRREGNGCVEDCETFGACTSETSICLGHWCTPEGHVCPAGQKWDSTFNRCAEAEGCLVESVCPYKPTQMLYWITKDCFLGNNPRTHACCPVNYGKPTSDYVAIEIY